MKPRLHTCVRVAYKCIRPADMSIHSSHIRYRIHFAHLRNYNRFSRVLTDESLGITPTARRRLKYKGSGPRGYTSKFTRSSRIHVCARVEKTCVRAADTCVRVADRCFRVADRHVRVAGMSASQTRVSASQTRLSEPQTRVSTSNTSAPTSRACLFILVFLVTLVILRI